ncbi:hypothetical protein CJ030_MR6G010431 [Morella rubra]|uniref:Uncharacterized protein n=1 Tax=Morella rubra TaxID=262757 RepID=A0A6A1VBA2_9ROSI|nr:hypothetical protein CJ030_MR6G010431 [Morella rubra]
MAPQQHPCLACQPASHRHAMTAHGPRPCHDTVPQQVLGHQPSQARTAGQQTKECHYTDGHHQWRSTTTPTGARWGKEEEGPQSRRSTTTHGGASSGGAAWTTARSTRYLRD